MILHDLTKNEELCHSEWKPSSSLPKKHILLSLYLYMHSFSSVWSHGRSELQNSNRTVFDCRDLQLEDYVDLYWRDYPSLISGFNESCLMDQSKSPFDRLIMASSQETDQTSVVVCLLPEAGSLTTSGLFLLSQSSVED